MLNGLQLIHVWYTVSGKVCSECYKSQIQLSSHLQHSPIKYPHVYYFISGHYKMDFIGVIISPFPVPLALCDSHLF